VNDPEKRGMEMDDDDYVKHKKIKIFDFDHFFLNIRR
jgi:hypothetical protein